MKHYIRFLRDKTTLSVSVAGGKGASLARLRRQDFRVPDGFVITPAAFQDFLSSFGIEMLVQRDEWAQGDVERINEMLMACRIPNKLVYTISSAYEKLGGKVAVRSSMVGEDTLDASFAGQLDTVLNVEGQEELLQALKTCWASLFNWRLWSYLTEREALSPGSLLESFSIAVVVQRMVDARAAGVAFSANPVTGQPSVVIEAIRGLGEALVQGLVDPDRYIVDSRGVLVQAVPVDEKSPALEEGQILRLADTVRNIGHRAGSPQDVEWAWDGREFHILQSRPITSLKGQRVYSNRMVSEYLPGLIKPLVWSTNSSAMMHNVFGRMFTALIGPNDIDFSLLSKRIHSRIYADNTMLGELFEQIGMPANFLQMISRDEKARHRRPSITPQMLRALWRVMRFAWRNSRVADEVRASLKQIERILEPFRRADWSSQDPSSLPEQIDRLLDLHGDLQWLTFIAPLNMMVRNMFLKRLVERWSPDVIPSDLVRGLVGLKALEPNGDLQDLAALARTLDKKAQLLLIEEDDERVRAGLSASDEGKILLAQVDAFLEQYGFLSSNGTDFSRTPWSENPSLIWQSIGRAVASPAISKTEDVKAIRQEARKRARSRLGPIRRAFFDRLLASTITYIDLRERCSLLLSESAYEMRRVFLTIADHLIARGDLDHCDDIFYLNYDQVRQLLDGTLKAEAAQAEIAAQKIEMEADALIEPPDVIYGDYAPCRPITEVDDKKSLVGISGSSGQVKGHARIVLDPTEAPTTLTREDILVVPFTDVGWTPLFTGIGGVVAETGGQLSHSAIVAREYGLPAVVSVKRATHLIQEGQEIVVDGDNGRVYLK